MMKFLNFIVIISTLWEGQLAFGTVLPDTYHLNRKLLLKGGADVTDSLSYLFFAKTCTATAVSDTRIVTACEPEHICPLPKAPARRRKRVPQDEGGEGEPAAAEATTEEAAVEEAANTEEANEKPEGGEEQPLEPKADDAALACESANTTVSEKAEIEGMNVYKVSLTGVTVEIGDISDKCDLYGFGDADNKMLAKPNKVEVTAAEKDGKVVLTAAEEVICTGDGGGAVICGGKLAAIIPKVEKCEKEVTAVKASAFKEEGGGDDSGPSTEAATTKKSKASSLISSPMIATLSPIIVANLFNH